MSIKHRVKDRAADGKMRALWLGYDYKRVRERPSKHMVWVNYKKAPGWWNRQFNNQPKRTQSARLCRAIVKGRVDAEAALFPLAMKPNTYYW